MTEKFFLWTDVETTGLDPKKDRLLEIAWTITDADYRSTHVEPKDHVIAQDDWLDFFNYWRTDVDPFVKDMHEKNGLFEELQEDGASNLDRAYLQLRQDLESLPAGAEVHLAGRSVHFDRDFLLANEFDGLFAGPNPLISHRIFDVRSIRTFLEGIGLTVPVPVPARARTEHRALDDVMGDIDFARSARALIKDAFPYPPVLVTETTFDAPYMLG